MKIEIAGELRNFRIEVNREIALVELCGGKWVATNTNGSVMMNFECEDRIDAIMRVAKYLRGRSYVNELKPSRLG